MQGRMPLISGLDINEDRKRLYYAKGWWSNTTLCDEWAHRVEQSPHSTYIKDETSSYTYGQVNDAAEHLALWLFQQGVKNGDVVTFQMPKWAEFAIVYVVCLKVGAVMYPVDVRGGHTTPLAAEIGAFDNIIHDSLAEEITRQQRGRVL